MYLPVNLAVAVLGMPDGTLSTGIVLTDSDGNVVWDSGAQPMPQAGGSLSVTGLGARCTVDVSAGPTTAAKTRAPAATAAPHPTAAMARPAPAPAPRPAGR